MPYAQADGARLYYEERGEGPAILGIHGAGSSAILWEDAALRLAGVGRAITYDRRGCSRSDRPPTYERTTVEEQVADALEVLDAAAAQAAFVIGRSFGGWVATELARLHPDRVTGLALLEPDAPALSPMSTDWIASLSARMEAAAARHDPDIVVGLVIDEVAGAGTWASWPHELREAISGNGVAMLAELRAYTGDHAGADQLAAVDHATLIVTARESSPPLRDPGEQLAKVLPNARLVEVSGGHLIDPAAPEIIAFAEDVVRR